jgi:hypothetical protein
VPVPEFSGIRAIFMSIETIRNSRKFGHGHAHGHGHEKDGGS